MIDFNDLIPKAIPASPPIDFGDLMPQGSLDAMEPLDPNMTGTALMDEIGKGRRPEPVDMPEIVDPQGLTGDILRPKGEKPLRAAWQIPKGLAGGVEQMVGTAGTMMRAMAEKASIGDILTRHTDLPFGAGAIAEYIVRKFGPKAPAEFFDKQMEKYAKQGEKWADFWEEQANKGWEAPEPEIMNAKWREMPVTKGAATISRAVPNYLAAIGLSTLTKNPQAGLLFISATSSAGAYRRQRKAGAGVTKAQAIATMTGAWEYVTELVPFQEIFKPAKSTFNKMFKLGTMEAAQEFVQGIGENFLEYFGYKAKDLKSVPDAVKEGLQHAMDNWRENVVAGAGLGIMGGGVSTGLPAMDKSIIEKAKQKSIEEFQTEQERLYQIEKAKPTPTEAIVVPSKPVAPITKPKAKITPAKAEGEIAVAEGKVRLFHGTPDKTLDLQSLKEKKSTQGIGIYFTDSAKEASKYKKTGKIIEVEAENLNLWNNQKATKAEQNKLGDLYDKYAKQLGERGEKAMNMALKELGYDGKVIEITPTRNEYIIFESSKDKLTVAQPVAKAEPAKKQFLEMTREEQVEYVDSLRKKPIQELSLADYRDMHAKRFLPGASQWERGYIKNRASIDADYRKAIKAAKETEPVKPKPSESANAFEQPISPVTEFEESKKDIKRKLRAKPGFAMIPSANEFKEIGNELKDIAKSISKPQEDVVIDVAGAIEKWRANTNLAGLYADWSQASLKKIKATAKQATDVDNWLDNPVTYQEVFDKLPDKVKGLGRTLKEDYEKLKNIAKDNDILQTWVDNYTPHLYKDNWTRLKRTLWPVGGKLGTKFRHAKQRVFKTMDEARKAGLHPITDPIVKNATYKYQLFKTLANKNLLETLKKMKREDGLPLIMGRPKNVDKLRIYENEYEWVNVPGLQRFMYVGEAGEMPMLVRQSAKADPQVAKVLNNVFAPWTPRAKWVRGYMWLRGRVKRLIMYNPLIHSWNIWSDVFDEVNFNPYSLVKVQLRGKKLYKTQDALVERAVAAGLQIQSGFGLARDLRKSMKETAAWEFIKPLRAIEEWSDKHLWQGTVRNAQIGLFETLTKKIAKEQPAWSQDKVDRTTTTYINTLLGTIPHTWFSKTGREVSSVLLFARNWTLSNIDMVVKAATYGRKGMGMKTLTKEEQTRIGKEYQKHLLKGFAGLMLFSNMLQLAFLLITNKLKRDKIIEGSEVELHTTFQNEKKHWYDIDTGLDTKKGQRVYLVAPFFRYIRDYIGWASEPAKTLYNKIEPVLKNTIETVANYSVWQKKQISKEGAPTWESIKQRMEYFVKGITPSAVFAARPGYVPTKFEWLIPFSGTWIRRGAPGGKFTGLMWDFRSKRGYKKSKVDEKIDEYLQRGDFKNAVITMAKEKRYMTTQGMKMRILETIAPLNYYWQTSGKREKAIFLMWLRENGHSTRDLQKDLGRELEELANREN